jgi:uncharacterized protein YbcV (DUF1398 family)
MGKDAVFGAVSSDQEVRRTVNATAIQEAARATLEGTLPFPAIVAKLIEAGVEYYHVDYVGGCKRFYSAEGVCVVTVIAYEGLPAVAAELDVVALRENIRDSQQRGQHYRDFTRRAMRAGVQGYYAFLRGQRVTYLGRAGDQHTEWFPGAGPKPGT